MESETIILVGADEIVITINKIKGQRVQVGVTAPDSVKIFRGELHEEIQSKTNTEQGKGVDSYKKNKKGGSDRPKSVSDSK